MNEPLLLIIVCGSVGVGLAAWQIWRTRRQAAMREQLPREMEIALRLQRVVHDAPGPSRAPSSRTSARPLASRIGQRQRAHRTSAAGDAGRN